MLRRFKDLACIQSEYKKPYLRGKAEVSWKRSVMDPREETSLERTDGERIVELSSAGEQIPIEWAGCYLACHGRGVL